MSSLLRIVGLDVCIAIASHYLWLKNYEPPTSLVSIFAKITALTTPFTVLLYSEPLVPSPTHAFLIANLTFVVTILASIVLYRLSPFHPLAKCPGPVLCKVSKIWIAYLAYRGKLHHYYKRLHDRYGPIVRIGPNEISVIDKELFPQIIGSQGMPKGPVWDSRRFVTSRDVKNHRNMHAVRDLKLHAELRKPWNKAFAKEPMKDYENTLHIRGNELVGHLKRACREGEAGIGSVDGAMWLSYFAFDFMGDIAFGGGHELMRDGDAHDAWKNMEKSLILPSVTQHIPWTAAAIHPVSSLNKYTVEFGKFARQQARKRASLEIPKRDLFHHLIAFTDPDPKTSPFPIIMANAVLAIVAGSDTVATSLSNILYYLLSHPEWLKRLTEELEQASVDLPSDSVPDPEQLADLSILNAIIFETLRLQPPLASLLQRAPAAGTGGKIIGDLFVPEGNAVQVPPYAVHRDPRYFSPDPDKFWPERWLTDRKDVVLDRSAFIPFSIGPANCVGRQLAMSELRYVTSLLVRTFEMGFDDGFNPQRWEEELEDRFLMVKGKLPVKLALRFGSA